MPKRDVTNQTLTGREFLNYSRRGRVWLVTSRDGKNDNLFYSVHTATLYVRVYYCCCVQLKFLGKETKLFFHGTLRNIYISYKLVLKNCIRTIYSKAGQDANQGRCLASILCVQYNCRLWTLTLPRHWKDKYKNRVFPDFCEVSLLYVQTVYSAKSAEHRWLSA